MGTELRTRASVEDGIKVDGRDGPIRVIEYQPGNGTRYVLYLLGLDRLPRPAREALGASEGGWTVVVNGYGQFPVHPKAHLSWHHVREHLRCSVHDAAVIAELVGHLLGLSHQTCEQFEQECR